MPNPNNPDLKSQQQELGQQIQQKEQELKAAKDAGQDTTQIEADLTALRDRKSQLQDDQKSYRDENRDQGGQGQAGQGGKGQGQGRQSAPGQQGRGVAEEEGS